MSEITAVRQAKWAFEHKAGASREQRAIWADELGEFKLFSNAHISHFTGLDAHDVATMTGKTDKTGGRLPGEALGIVLEVCGLYGRSEFSGPVIKRALAAGVSSRMISRLTGFSQSKIARANRA